jgi:hypothetical protein
MVVTGPRWELGQGQESAINLAIKNINDLSGFDKAIVQIIKPDGSIQSSYTMTYDDGSRAATAPITKGGGAIAKATWMPVSDADVEFRFRAFLYDKAGNVTQVPDQNLYLILLQVNMSYLQLQTPILQLVLFPAFRLATLNIQQG